MQFKHNKILYAALVTNLVTGSALAHEGRRFDIKVVEDRLVTQGYISGTNPTDDGNGIVRDYYNAIHAHWSPNPQNNALSEADLPGFDIRNQPELDGDAIFLQLIGVKKWTNANFSDFAHNTEGHPSDMHGAMDHTMPDMGETMHDVGGHYTDTPMVDPNRFAPIAGEAIDVYYEGTQLIEGGAPIELRGDGQLKNHFDLRFFYIPDGFVQGNPTTFQNAPDDSVYLVEFELSTGDLGIGQSDTIHAIFSPPGSDVAGSHGLSLATEEAFGTPIPEPTSIALLGLGGLVLVRRQR